MQKRIPPLGVKNLVKYTELEKRQLQAYERTRKIFKRDLKSLKVSKRKP